MTDVRPQWVKPKKTVFGLLAMLVVFAAGTTYEHYRRSQDASNPIMREPQSDLAAARMTGYFPNVVLTTHENRTVRFYDDLIKDKVVLISFMYSQCKGICPMTTANLIRVQKLLGDRLGHDIFLYSISLDPQTDTPAVLNRYAGRAGASAGWSFLTGHVADIELLRHKLGIYDPDPILDADRSQHGGILVYGNDRLGRWAAIPALATPQRLVSAILRVAEPPETVQTESM